MTATAGRLRPGHALAACLAAAAALLGVATVVIAAAGPVPVILATVGCSALLVSSIRPLVTALLPACIRNPQELAATNTAAAGVETISLILGPLGAAAVLALAEPAALLAGVVVVLLLTAAGTLSLRTGTSGLSSTHGVTAQVLDGLRTILRREPVRLITMLVGAQAFGRGAFNVIVVSLAIDRLGIGESGVGLLLGAIDVGGLVGLPVAARVAATGRHGRNLTAGTLVWGLPFVLIGLTVQDTLVLVLLATAGLGNTVLDISADSLLQRLVPTGRLATPLGGFEATVFLTKAAGATVAGLVIAGSGTTAALVTVGALPLAVAALAAAATLRLDGSMRERDAGVALLQAHAIFSPLVLSAVDQVSSAAVVEQFAPGEQIVVEGDVGDRYHVIESGEVDVVRGGVVVDAMAAGDGFGEVALLDGATRNATIVARTPTVTRSLDHHSFVAAMRAPGPLRPPNGSPPHDGGRRVRAGPHPTGATAAPDGGLIRLVRGTSRGRVRCRVVGRDTAWVTRSSIDCTGPPVRTHLDSNRQRRAARTTNSSSGVGGRRSCSPCRRTSAKPAASSSRATSPGRYSPTSSCRSSTASRVSPRHRSTRTS